MEDWEDEIPPLPAKEQLKIKWDDKHIDDSDIKESWEDEDELASPTVIFFFIAFLSIRYHDLTFAFYFRLVEEADYKSTIELFSKKGDNKTFDNFIPKFESDFVEYVELISHKLRPYEAAMRLSLASLEAANVKDVASSVTTILARSIKYYFFSVEWEDCVREKKSSKKRPRGLKARGVWKVI
ncbi:hypothetical protein GOBAR_DD03402 [Gossypium barbadense]|nr:hypothetical protein GOBAR_DD03402 [Gossypium barbadense]